MLLDLCENNPIVVGGILELLLVSCKDDLGRSLGGNGRNAIAEQILDCWLLVVDRDALGLEGPATCRRNTAPDIVKEINVKKCVSQMES